MVLLRRNFYNKDILIMNYDILPMLRPEEDDILLINQITFLIKQYDNLSFKQYDYHYRSSEHFTNVPAELRSWPNKYFGILLSDKRNSGLIQLAFKASMDDYIYLRDELYVASGYAFLNGDLEIAIELKNLYEYISSEKGSSCSRKREYLQIVSEEALDYLLSFIGTRNCIEKDKEVVFYDGESFVLMNATEIGQGCKQM